MRCRIPISDSLVGACVLLGAAGLLAPLFTAGCAHGDNGEGVEQVAREMGARSPVVIVRRSEVVADCRLIGATYAIDGQEFWQESNGAGLAREAPVFDGKLIDGEHTLTVTFEGERGTKKWARSESVTFTASPTTATIIEIVTHDGDLVDATDDEPVRIRFAVGRPASVEPVP